MAILLVFAILSGILTILSPCILPILPIVLSSSATEQKARPLGLITGLIVSFSVFTLLVTRIVELLGIPAGTLRLLSAAFLIVIGLSMIIPALATRLEQVLSFLPRLAGSKPSGGSGFRDGFLTGASLGLVWAPCAGPILSAVIVVAATQTMTINSALVIFAYSIGVGIPLLAVTYGGRELIQRVRLLSGNLPRIQKVFGGLVVATALLIVFNLDVQFTAWATQAIPAGWTSGLTAFENSPLVQDQLAKLRGQPGPSLSASTGGPPPDFGQAPDFAGGNNWINSDPLTLSDLKGKVVLVDFWTYSCVNCIRTFPYLQDWYAKYKAYGFVIIGVHTPEFAFEHDTANVIQAVGRFGIAYPVVQDNDYAIWNAYNNYAWPAEYLIDAEGRMREQKLGEGGYAETEKAIQTLLAEAGHPVQQNLTQGPQASFSPFQTPETYIGTDRMSGLGSPEPVARGKYSAYSIPADLPLHAFAISGSWDFEPQYAQAGESGTQLSLHFYAKDVYLVMTSDQPLTATVISLTPGGSTPTEDVNAQNRIAISAPRLYHLAHFDQLTDGVITIQFDAAGVRIYSFTFGG